jgi:hypothetical protein
VSVTVTGLDELFRKLDRAASFDKLEDPMQRGVLRLQAYMQDYPPAPPLSRYVRTGTLGRRWTTQVDRNANGLVGKVGNNVPYGPWVQSAQFQARFHARTGWRTDERAVEQNRAEIVADFQQAVNKALGGE